MTPWWQSAIVLATDHDSFRGKELGRETIPNNIVVLDYLLNGGTLVKLFDAKPVPVKSDGSEYPGQSYKWVVSEDKKALWWAYKNMWVWPVSPGRLIDPQTGEWQWPVDVHPPGSRMMDTAVNIDRNNMLDVLNVLEVTPMESIVGAALRYRAGPNVEEFIKSLPSDWGKLPLYQRPDGSWDTATNRAWATPDMEARAFTGLGGRPTLLRDPDAVYGEDIETAIEHLDEIIKDKPKEIPDE
jgi:hypothetical protein